MEPRTLDILMITYNRAEYTLRTLTQLLDTCTDQTRVWIWQNGTDRDTTSVVDDLSAHGSIYRVHRSPDNCELRIPTNWFWGNATAQYLSKVDDDCLLPKEWHTRLIDAHEANPRFGIIGCWRFYDEDFVPHLALKKVNSFTGGHQLMVNCWVQGSGYVMKRSCRESLGYLTSTESFTDYCVRGALAGWINGWHYPFIHEEHMDDPRSPYCMIRTDEEFLRQRPLSARKDDVRSIAEWAQRVRHMAHMVQAASSDPRVYVGWRRLVRRLGERAQGLVGQREPWRNAGS